MARRIFIFIPVIAIATSILLTSKVQASGAGGDPNAAEEPEMDNDIDRMVDNMSTRDKITQMMMPDFRNWEVDGEEEAVTSLNDDIRSALKEYKFGGVILFAENVQETEQTARLTHDFQHTVIEEDDTPLLLSIDQEGGVVTRLGTGTNLPGNMALGAAKSEQHAYQAGAITANELSSLGINTNFAPTVDVNNNPANPVIGLRSFSSDPWLVTVLGNSFISGIQDHGVSSAVKHFPGHGDTEVDSHVGLPVVDKSLDELNETELVPFRDAANHAEIFMTAHIQYPQIEEETMPSEEDGEPVNLPATLSPTILTDLVRDDMGYEGLIVTDAMNMEAITDNFGEKEASLQAIKAGVDVLVMPTILRNNEDLENLDDIIGHIEEAVDTGEISEDRLDESVTRILELKEKRGILDLTDNLPTADEQVAIANENVGSEENLKTEREMAFDAMTVLKDDHGVLPVVPKEDGKVLFVASDESQMAGTEFGITRMQDEGILPDALNFETTYFDEESEAGDFNEQVSNADHVVVYTNMETAEDLTEDQYNYDVPQGIFDFAASEGKTTIQVSTNKPYDGVNFSNVDATVLSYGYLGPDPTEGGEEQEAAFGPNIPAAVELLFGRRDASGTLPVDLPVIDDGEMSDDEIEYEMGYSAR